MNSDGKRSAYDSIVRQGFFLADKIQGGYDVRSLSYEEAKADTLANGIYAFGNINIGKYLGAARSGAVDGWWLDTDTVLPNNEQADDFAGTVRHELGHALGICFYWEEINGKYFIDPYLEDQRSWTLHLVDQNGNPAKAGLPIVTSKDATDPSKSFVVDEEVTPDGKGYLYFVGDHVTEVLDGAQFFGRSALPVNGWEEQEQKGQYKFEGSHLQTAGMMSHRDYSNYTTFLEVELAVLQDLGYKFDRKAYFGRSIYGNGGTIVNNQGFFQRNAEGTNYLDNTYSVVPLGVGLHIYGSNNTVNQNANILTIGTGAVGVRVDGTGNTLIVPAGTEIHADGRRGNGLMVSYGNGHTVEQAGTITALGDGGTGVRFDFGSSSMGARDEYRGSYIRYMRSVKPDGTISKAKNLSLTIDDADTYNVNKDELKGALLENYNLSGMLAGNENAIYIGK
ncbi:MAG: autotransporter outer membrane beta-barrel domain-containing protein, partial [Selenomonas sp.]|nr:autotransporter outer membrane beta-barrel domain-containing protein [Selenomonas sp.]